MPLLIAAFRFVRSLTPVILLSVVGAPAAEKTSAAADTAGWPASFGLGRRATAAEIDRWAIAIRPDGKGLPAGSGTAAVGQGIYAAKCMMCHGTGNDPAGAKFPAVALFKKATPGKPAVGKYIGTYWPYATTLFDYTRRAMPTNLPGSLTNDEVYALAAYILAESQVIESSTVLNSSTLPKVKMPAQPLFVPDDRKGGPEVK